MTTVDPRIEVRGAGVRFGDFQALRDVNWSLDGTGVVGLIGLNGAGKTTLIRSILGLQELDAGSIEIPIGRDAIGFCPDTPGFEPWLTATEVLAQSAALGGHVAGETAYAPADALRIVGLDRAGHRRTAGFSRGMLQRLGIAAALVRDPQVLILDEPTSALDPEGRQTVLDLIRTLGEHRTVVFSSHLLADVEDLTQEILVLNRGETVYSGRTEDFLKQHASDPTIEVRFADGRVRKAAKPEWESLLSAAASEAGQIDEIRTDLPSLSEAFFAAIGDTPEPVGEKS
ncbi:ABC transporter ATP-binding protein [Nocardia stercoris]|uniref:ABC transporter ATP-binding protein n=1 Tax=Nocardia stercoris TaxID=2483361 RepID=UPI001319EFE5|nr:ABC transporter ATP-binding protein [Nocardia stercoris]